MTRPAAVSRREGAALLLILIAAAAIRFATADYSLWFDEIASAFFAHQPLARLWSGWMLRESNPPLYYSLLRGWIAAFGTSDAALRSLSIVIGVAGIGAAWAVARRLGGRVAGLATAALTTASAAHVAFSQEVRGYVLAYSAVLVALIGAIAFLDRPRRRALVLYALAALVALYAHTTMAVFAALTGATVAWLVRSDRRALLDWLAANALIAAGWAWWAAISAEQMVRPHGTIGWIPAPDVAGALAIVEQAYLPGYVIERPLSSGLLLLVQTSLVLHYAWRDRRPGVMLLAVLAVGTPLVLFAASQATPIMLVRTLFWASGPFLILTALALAALPLRLGGVLIVALLAFELAMLIHWLPGRQREDWRGALQTVGRLAPHGIVIVDGDAMAIAAAHYRDAAPGVRIVALRRPPIGANHWADGLFDGPHLGDAAALALFRQQRCVFTLTIGDQDPGRVLHRAGHRRWLRAATGGGQPMLWLWQVGPPDQAALSMPSSPSLR